MGAIRFDAAADNLKRTSNLPPIASWTIAGWFRIVTKRLANSTFFNFGTAGANPQYFVQTDTDGLTLLAFNGTTTVAGPALVVGQWYHLAAAVADASAGNFKVYVDGALAITNDGVGTITAGEIVLGNNFGSEFLNGDAAAVNVWDAALSQAELIQQRRFAPPVVRKDRVNSQSPLAHKADVYDYSGRGNKWTAGGTLTTDDGPPNVVWQPRRPRRYQAFLGIDPNAGGATAPKFRRTLTPRAGSRGCAA